jgi:hypothetical protein
MRSLTVVTLICAALLLPACTHLPSTDTEWKEIIASIPVLFVVMWIASAANALSQLGEARKNGTPMPCAEYLQHWPETLYTILINTLGFVGLLVTDQLPVTAPLGLKFLAVVGLGFGANAIADKFTSGGRSKALATAPADR